MRYDGDFHQMESVDDQRVREPKLDMISRIDQGRLEFLLL